MAVKSTSNAAADALVVEGHAESRYARAKPAQFAVSVTAEVLESAVTELAAQLDAGLIQALLPRGALEARREITLPANTLVDDVSVVLSAYPAALTPARAVAQVRTAPPQHGYEAIAERALIVDLGVPRTVTAVAVPSGFGVYAVRAWNGTAFANDPPVFPVPNALPADGSSFGSYIVFPAEVRTERLEITLTGDGAEQDLIDGTILSLPDAPANLQLAIEGSGIVWREQGIVTPTTGSDLTTTAWNDQGQRRVDLTEALRARLGDPTAGGEATLALTLTSTAPGVLLISDLQGETRRIRRATLTGQSGEAVEFDGEGRIVQALTVAGLPAEAQISEIRFTASATPKPPRTIPPVGPDPSPKVTLTLDPDHAVLVRLPVAAGLAVLEGLKVAATAGPAGAEIRALLWDSRVDAEEAVTETLVSIPTGPFDAPASEPATLAAGVEGWARLPFAEPVEMPADRPLWAAILCSRGAATLTMTDAAPQTATPTPTPTEVGRVRVGPSAGPFQTLPALFDEEGYAGLRARVRVTGTAPAESPIDPLALGWPATATVMPTKKGTRVTLPVGAGGGPALDLVALTAMTLTLTDIDVVSDI
ncbi:hypothetical protein [uncultured Rhodospira sp.]|uniref:hypothetical protein n=1 Tax=uncultured Rhodospira sp. TaxID=1936189 RepID=UPI00262F8A1C|nr:hypothetical protein [uncultured Rhodospira sp.]